MLARAFMAKAVFGISTTRILIERLQVDSRHCRLSGWGDAPAGLGVRGGVYGPPYAI